MSRRREGGLVLDRTREADPPISTEVHNHIFAVQKRLLEEFPAAEFDLVYGPDEAYHLKVWTDERSILRVMEVVEDDLLNLLDDYGIELYVIPLSLQDKKNDTPHLPRHMRGKGNGTNSAV